MTQKSYPWGGTSVGDATIAPYSDDEWSDLWSILFQFDRTRQGPIYTNHASYSGNLLVTNPSGNTIRVASGAAVVDGKVFTSDANVDTAVAVDGSYSVVLRKDFTAQTVRLAVRSSGVTQTDGVLWEVEIAGVVRASGVFTITDKRHFIRTGLPQLMSLLNIQNGPAGPDDFYDPLDTQSDKAITGSVIVQMGAAQTTVLGEFTLTYPVPFSGKPIMFLTSNGPIHLYHTSISATQVAIRSVDLDGVSAQTYFSWMAIGPAGGQD